MRINEIGLDYLKELVKGQTGADGGPREAAQPTAPVKAFDRVNISEAGRALAQGETPELGAERIAEIRARILEGAYDSLESVDHLARQILASGDLT